MLRQSNLLKNDETAGTLKIKTIQKINALGMQALSYVLSYRLSETEIFASKNTLINYARPIQRLPSTNLVKGHGSEVVLVEDIEERFGFQPMPTSEIATGELILAVKVRDAFRPSEDEMRGYPLDGTLHDINNLKSRASGNRIIGHDKTRRIRYTIAVNTGADNAVVTTYKISSKYTESKISESGLTRYVFQALPSRRGTLRELNLYKKCLPGIRFGNDSTVTYINN